MGKLFFLCTSDNGATDDGFEVEATATGKSAKLHHEGNFTCDIYLMKDPQATRLLDAFYRGHGSQRPWSSHHVPSVTLLANTVSGFFRDDAALSETAGVRPVSPSGVEPDTDDLIASTLSQGARDGSATTLSAPSSALHAIVGWLNGRRQGGPLQLPKLCPGQGVVVYCNGRTVINLEPLTTVNGLARDHAQPIAAENAVPAP